MAKERKEQPLVDEPALNTDEPILEVPPERKPFEPDIGKINKLLLFKLFLALVMNQPTGYLGAPGVRRIGAIFGAPDYQSEKECWLAIKHFVYAAKKEK